MEISPSVSWGDRATPDQRKIMVLLGQSQKEEKEILLRVVLVCWTYRTFTAGWI